MYDGVERERDKVRWALGPLSLSLSLSTSSCVCVQFKDGILSKVECRVYEYEWCG